MEHIDESAELYALGLLEPAERSRIDEHVARCDACAARLGDAEGAVAALVVASQRLPQRSPRAQRWPFAVAAAFALTSGALLAQNVALHAALRDDSAGLAALAHSHFAHTQFHTPAGVAIDAKVIYDRNAEWLDVVASGIAPAHVRVITASGTAGADRALAGRDGASTLFVRHPGAVREIRLIDAAGATIAVAHPAVAEPE